MYENYTRQSLPDRWYRELLGSALCVFAQNNSFIIKIIIKIQEERKTLGEKVKKEECDWYILTDSVSGKLKPIIQKIISYEYGYDIEKLFSELIDMRNRIVHSYQITNKQGKQVLATKEKIKHGNDQFEITEEYLKNFIKLNEKLSDKLYDLRESLPVQFPEGSR